MNIFIPNGKFNSIGGWHWRTHVLCMGVCIHYDLSVICYRNHYSEPVDNCECVFAVSAL